MQKDYIFLNETGITDTKASRIADYAKNAYVGLLSECKNLTLYNTTLESLDGNNVKILSYGANNSDLKEYPAKLERIGQLKSLDAWLREAVKAHQEAIRESKCYSIKDWAKEFNITLPEEPKLETTITSDDVIAEWDIKKRNRYYALEAKAATIGQAIHPDGPVDDARKDYYKILSNPKKQVPMNDSMLIYSYVPSIDKEDIENLYYTLQQTQAQYQSELNQLKSEIKSRIANDAIDKRKVYNDRYTKYGVEYTELNGQYALYAQEMQKKVQNLKIVIPNDLKDIYTEISQLGKS